MQKPTIILATSNGIGMGHLTRSSAIASELKEFSNPIIVSMAAGVIKILVMVIARRRRSKKPPNVSLSLLGQVSRVR